MSNINNPNTNALQAGGKVLSIEEYLDQDE